MQNCSNLKAFLRRVRESYQLYDILQLRNTLKFHRGEILLQFHPPTIVKVLWMFGLPVRLLTCLQNIISVFARVYMYVHISVCGSVIILGAMSTHVSYSTVLQLCSVRPREDSWRRCWMELRDGQSLEPGTPLILTRRTEESKYGERGGVLCYVYMLL